jgi:hypothetical protein
MTRSAAKVTNRIASPRIARKYYGSDCRQCEAVHTPHNAAKRNMIALAALVFSWPGVWEWGNIVSNDEAA